MKYDELIARTEAALARGLPNWGESRDLVVALLAAVRDGQNAQRCLAVVALGVCPVPDWEGVWWLDTTGWASADVRQIVEGMRTTSGTHEEVLLAAWHVLRAAGLVEEG